MLGSGSRIGGYEIVAPLRSGGMASFYLARRVGPAGFVRPVGIKVVHAHLAQDRAFVEMFLDEARLSARIVHPNVVHVEELGESDGMFFLAMELVHGVALSALLRRLSEKRRTLSPPVACAIAMKVADGLHAAHEVKDEQGALLEVVHRDVSPQNILVAADGRVKLIDFGIAKARGRLQETDGAGSLKGKLRYMSPEQAWGRPIDRRTDVYALGIVLWESLTGRRLFGGDNDVDALELVRAPIIPPPSSINPSVPPAIDEVLRTALAVSPEDRFDTAQAFRRAIGNACPAAIGVEPDEIGALVRATLPDELARERALLGSFETAVPEPRESDAEIAERTVEATREVANDAPAATVAGTPRALSDRALTSPSAIPETAVRPLPRSSRTLAIGLPIAFMVLALGATAYIVERTRSVPGPCDGIVRIDGGDGARIVMPFDTRGGTRAFALGGMRNPDAPHTPSIAFSYLVPGTGPRSVEIDTALAETDPLFDTIIGVFHGACSEEMARRDPDVRLDDDTARTERRAAGGVRANGGETLTLVLSGYGGALEGHLDEGVGAIAITTTQTHPPVLRAAHVEVGDAVLTVHVEGSDDDGDATAIRLRFQGRDGAPIAEIDFDDPMGAPGDFSASGTLDVGDQGEHLMAGASAVEVSVLDRGGNASEPLVVDVTATATDAGMP